MKYKLVSSRGYDDFLVEVESAMYFGWKPSGPVTSGHSDTYLQWFYMEANK